LAALTDCSVSSRHDPVPGAVPKTQPPKSPVSGLRLTVKLVGSVASPRIKPRPKLSMPS